MINRKKIREITGYTFQKELRNPDSWYKRAISFHESAIVIYKAQESITNGSIIFSFNCALSLELILKAILVAQKEEFEFTHTLRVLAEEAKVKLDNDQKHTLDFFTESFTWHGRYPTPTKEERWDNFHDNIFEKQVLRSRSGNTTRVVANSKRFPSMDNYMKIWGICLSEYKEPIEC